MTSAPLTFRGRLWLWTKRLAASVLVILMAAAPVATFGVPKLAACPKARARVEKSLTRALGTPVEIGAMSFTWTDGLRLHDVSAKADPHGCSFRIDSVEIKPRWSKLLSGKVRLRAEFQRPEVVVADTGTEIRALRLPKFGKKGLGLEHVKIVDGTCILKNGADDRSLRIDGITTEGTGALQHRTVRMDLKSLTGSFRGAAVTGKGLLRLSPDGFRGELDVNESAAKEPELLDALRAAGVTLRKAPAMSEWF